MSTSLTPFILSPECWCAFGWESRGVRLNVRGDSFLESVVVKDSDGEPRRLRPPRTHLVLLSLLLFPLVLLVVDLLTPPDIRLGPLMVAAPVLSAALVGPAGVLLVAVVTTPCMVLAAAANLQLNATNFPVQFAAFVLLSLAALATSVIRRQRERELANSRWVAQVAQRILLRSLPRRAGAFTLASLYRAADEEAAIGGDLYAAVQRDHTIRILLGDAQGKGMAALEMANSVLNAFRRAARHHSRLDVLVAQLETEFGEDMRDYAATPAEDADIREKHLDESFTTAVILEAADTDQSIALINLGHPPPLLVDRGTVTSIEPTARMPPIGLADFNGQTVQVQMVDFPAGATLLLYTDGVIEARNSAGIFYPLADRLRSWTHLAPDELLTAVHDDLRRYVGTRFADDVAMVAIRRTDPPAAAPQHEFGPAHRQDA
ncbi:PP2C family protein-serine/threonine phosphatase [Streptomyces sp. NPDC051098]|uniref:PP2C family protein-serine/threonine phosphatase n=1 Tax=Streptomyces sp. NPDC051098 TaxID=3155411 RepID=UPI0034378132